VIVFDREKTLVVTHASTPAKCKKEPMFSLKLILLGAAFVTTLGMVRTQGKSEQKPAGRHPSTASGRETFLKYCASCHGEDGKGNGQAAIAIETPLPDLTTLLRRHEGKYPAGYVSAVLKFGKSLAAHGSEDMPVWGSRFKTLDPVRDPTGQQHVDDVVAYIGSLQAK
jgi:mono/diheme cytochrome c family protein